MINESQITFIAVVTLLTFIIILWPPSGILIALLLLTLYGFKNHLPMTKLTKKTNDDIKISHQKIINDNKHVINPNNIDEIGDDNANSNTLDLSKNPIPINASDSLLDHDAPFESPQTRNNYMKELWFPEKSYKDEQQDAFKKHWRRQEQWSSVARWTQKDKDKYEQARRKREKDIASSLRPDPYMIIQDQAPNNNNNNSAHLSDQPYALLTSDHNIQHSARYNTFANGCGDLASHLKTVI